MKIYGDKEKFLERFKNETGYNFNIISQECENELTVFRTTSGIKYEENTLYKDSNGIWDFREGRNIV